MGIIVPGGAGPCYKVSDMQEDVHARGWDTDVDTEALALANGVLREIFGEREWGFLENTSSHTLSIGNTSLFAVNAAPSDLRFQGAEHLHIGHPTDLDDKWELRQVGADEFRDLRDRLELTRPGNRGRPVVWAQIDNIIRVHPSPDLAYTTELTYQLVPADLSAPGDCIPLPKPYQDIVTAGVLAELALRERDFASADRWAQVYQRRHASLVRHDPNRFHREDLVVKNTGEWDSYTGVGDRWIM